jgi:hypothetical protein
MAASATTQHLQKAQEHLDAVGEIDESDAELAQALHITAGAMEVALAQAITWDRIADALEKVASRI